LHLNTAKPYGAAAASDPPGHPARETCIVAAGLLAHGSSPPSGLPGADASDPDRRKLAAYSCGGSSGFALASSPNSLLAPYRRAGAENHDGLKKPASDRLVKSHKEIFISLCYD
jgi:hypothetical protein